MAQFAIIVGAILFCSFILPPSALGYGVSEMGDRTPLTGEYEPDIPKGKMGSKNYRDWSRKFDDYQPDQETVSAGLRELGTLMLARRAEAAKQTNYEEQIKSLNTIVEQQQKALDRQKVEMKSVMQQVDALVLQNGKTLKLIESSSKSGAESKEDQIQIVPTGGVYYIRWGRNVCPSTAVELYQGQAGGPHSTSNTGGSNTLCLPKDPQWGNYVETAGSTNYIYGVEYSFADMPFSPINNGGKSLINHDMPCTVCHSPVRSTQIMIPARRECPTGWTAEYKGYIVCNYATYSRSDYICVDEEPEAKVAGHEAKGGLLATAVRVSCGSLSCPYYVQGRQLACIVCTK